jgi:hypothetical protein
MDNDALLAKLNRWAREDARIDPHAFGCSYYDCCNASVGGTLWRGEGCQMSYVGRRYGLDASSEQFRLMLVGIDHGEKGSADFEDWRRSIESCYQDGGKNFNADYRGVVKTAAIIFGGTAQYCQEMCTMACQRSRDPAAAQCVLDRIARANSVKCTPENQVNRTSRATWPMKVNCAHHLMSEIRLLKPGLVVFHGAPARFFVIPELKSCDLDVSAVGDISDRHGPVLYESRALGAHLLFLYHPSHNHLAKQWEAIVIPAVRYMRENGIVPI